MICEDCHCAGTILLCPYSRSEKTNYFQLRAGILSSLPLRGTERGLLVLNSKVTDLDWAAINSVLNN